MSEIYIPKAVQRKVIALSNGCCEYCLHPENYATDFFHFDHIIPISEGGTVVRLNCSTSLEVVAIATVLKGDIHIISTL
jgi:5-methylcytosine-specific restriction endonuclease McrA